FRRSLVRIQSPPHHKDSRDNKSRLAPILFGSRVALCRPGRSEAARGALGGSLFAEGIGERGLGGSVSAHREGPPTLGPEWRSYLALCFVSFSRWANSSASLAHPRKYQPSIS